MAKANSTTATHGMSRSPEWEAWRAMRKRCNNPNSSNYDRYGGRGITVCARWDASFADFLADVGPRPTSRHSLHRIDNNGNYEPGNCCWATPTVQARNRSLPRKGVIRRQPTRKAGDRPANFKDLTGQAFGRWTVVAYHGREQSQGGGNIWNCQCQCGTTRAVKATSLVSGRSQSCGCRHKEIVTAAGRTKNKTHGRTGTKEYRAWNQMLQRCHNPENPTYERYGAKGVTVCERWRESFEAFFADVGLCPSPNHTLDRIDPAGNYGPDNVRWLPAELQSANRKNVKRFDYRGERLTIPELAARIGIKPATLRARLVVMGWSVERATTQSSDEYHGRC